MADLIMEILEESGLEIDLNEGHIDPYLQLEDIEVIEAPRTVDTEMSDTSENPVQNKVIKAYVDNVAGDKHYTHTQIAANNTWLVQHNLDKFPAVMVVDSGNSVVTGDMTKAVYDTNNSGAVDKAEGIINQNGGTLINGTWVGTLAQYNVIGSKDANTTYIITDEPKIYQGTILLGQSTTTAIVRW